LSLSLPHLYLQYHVLINFTTHYQHRTQPKQVRPWGSARCSTRLGSKFYGPQTKNKV